MDVEEAQDGTRSRFMMINLLKCREQTQVTPKYRGLVGAFCPPSVQEAKFVTLCGIGSSVRPFVIPGADSEREKEGTNW